MGKKSVKENKNIYQVSREAEGLTREQASELLEYISEDKIEKIESEKTPIRPEEVLTMAKAYRKPELPNYYCSHECPIGTRYIPEIEKKDLPMIVLEILAGLNELEKQKDRLIEIAVDGELTEDEYADFVKVRGRLSDFKKAINEMGLWIDQTIIDKGLDEKTLKE